MKGIPPSLGPLLLAMILHAFQPTSAQESDPCFNYIVLNDTWRATTNVEHKHWRCDSNWGGYGTSLQWDQWHRFVLEGVSVRMPETCVPEHHCGTDVPLWMNGAHPRPEDGIVTRQVCGSYKGQCCYPLQYHIDPIKVKDCPGNYFVYKLSDPNWCHLGYCADSNSGLPTTSPAPTTSSYAAHVTCMENFMAFALERSSSIGLHEDHLRLNDPNCSLYTNGTHVLANMSLTTCGTIMEDDGDYLIFKNAVVSFDNATDIITRRHYVDIEFFCKYPKKSQVTAEFDVHQLPLSFVQKGFGTFTYQFEFFQSAQFNQMIDPNTYPLRFNLGDMMYMQIEAICSVPNTELFAESCTAAPSDNPNEPLSYKIIENGCKVDETVQIYSSHQSKVQLGMKAFKFIGMYDQVFITCSVILCKAGEAGSRCSQGCTNSSNLEHIVSKREAPFQTAKHYISQGPLRLRRGMADTATQPISANQNLIVVVGGLLAAVAMICGALIYRTAKSDIKYERLPSNI